MNPEISKTIDIFLSALFQLQADIAATQRKIEAIRTESPKSVSEKYEVIRASDLIAAQQELDELTVGAFIQKMAADWNARARGLIEPVKLDRQFLETGVIMPGTIAGNVAQWIVNNPHSYERLWSEALAAMADNSLYSGEEVYTKDDGSEWVPSFNYLFHPKTLGIHKLLRSARYASKGRS